MSVWEYKVVTSGKGGFATPALLESFLNQLGKEEWEIIQFQPQPDNPLAFTGVARRPTQRDWTLEDAAAAAARTEADKLRAEFEAKFKGVASGGSEGKPEAAPVEQGDEFRRIRDTERDLDPDAEEETGAKDEWDELSEEEELPSFFDAIKPHMRRNQRGPGYSAGVEFLAKKWDMTEPDVLGALKECGFAIPEDDDADPVYIEYDGDLYWVERNRRGELWINTREKPRAVFRTVQGRAVTPEQPPAPAEGEAAAAAPQSDAPAPERQEHNRHGRQRHGSNNPSEPLPTTGPELLDKMVPQMRRNRDRSGVSGSVSFLSRALRRDEKEIVDAFAAVGLLLPAGPEDKPAYVEISGKLWWLNRDQRGGIWINGREKGAEEPTPAATPPAEGAEGVFVPSGLAAAAPAADAPAPSPFPSDAPAEASSTADAAASADKTVLTASRPHLKEARAGVFASEICELADALGKTAGELVAALTAAGLVVPEKPREKPVYVDLAGEAFWFAKNAKDELWLNAKASKFSADGESRSSRPRSRSRRGSGSDAPTSAESAPVEPAPADSAPTPAPSSEGGGPA